MAILEASDLQEKETAERFISETPRLQGIQNVRIEFGEDHSGDPAMWLVFRLDSAWHFDLEAARSFNEYAAVIQTKILHSGLKRFPYIRLEQVS